MFFAGGCALLYFGYQMYKTGADATAMVVTLIGGVLMFPLGVLVYNKSYRDRRRGFDGRWALLKSKGLTPAIERDFKNGSRIYDGRLIVGLCCVMGRKTGLVVLYKEISAIRRHCHTIIYESGGTSHTGTVEISAGGKDYVICNMKSYSVRQDDWDKLCTFLAYNHPSIYIDPDVKHTKEYIDDTSSDDD